MKSYEYIKFAISPNGRYLFYSEHEFKGKKGEPKHSIDEYGSHLDPTTPSIGVVVEIIRDPITLKFEVVARRVIHDFEARYYHKASKFHSYSYDYYGYNGDDDQKEEKEGDHKCKNISTTY